MYAISHYEGLLPDNLYKKSLKYEKAYGKWEITRNSLLYLRPLGDMRVILC